MSNTSATRKLTTIFYADVAGYSRLTGDDELRTHSEVMSVLDYANKTIGDKGGVVLRYAGDAILAEFSSVVSSVDAAIDVQQELARRNQNVTNDEKVQLRIGINLGEVLSDRGEIYGDGVNVAARLESIAVPGGICISHKVGAEIDGKVQVEFSDGGAYSLKNIANPMNVMHWHPDPAEPLPQGTISTTSASGKNKGQFSKRITIAISLAVVAIFVFGIAIWYASQQQPPPMTAAVSLALPAEPSLAVLPFQAIGEDDSVDYFSNGLTNDLITDLSKFEKLFISASNSVFSYQNKLSSVKQTAAELGVRYILQGSAQQSSNRVRVNVELVEAATGRNLWTERYDRDMADVFQVQDEIVREIIASLTVKVDEVELQRSLAKRPSNLEAYDYVLRGQELLRQNTRSSNFESQSLFQLAIEKDPGYPLAYTGLARAVLQASTDGWSNNPMQGIRRAHDLAQAAISIESNAEGHALLGFTYLLMKHYDLAITELNQAIELNPNDADSFAALGGVNLWTSNLDLAVAAFERSIRLDPKASPDVTAQLGAALFLQTRYQEALAQLEASAARKPNDLFTQAMLASAYLKLGREQEAKDAAQRVRKIHPFFKTAPYRGAFVQMEHGKLLADTLVSLGFE
jgi:adenylate cyclase